MKVPPIPPDGGDMVESAVEAGLVNPSQKWVEIPFLGRFEQPMINGHKTLTTRTKQYGEVGDWFMAFGYDFEIIEIQQTNLASVATRWREEGVESQSEFMRVWSMLHRGIWNPNEKVYTHKFQKVRKH